MPMMPESEQPSVYMLWDRIQEDPQFKAMLSFLKKLEPQYEAVLSKLSPDEQDLICDYVSAHEVMSWRALEYACENMNYTEGSSPV